MTERINGLPQEGVWVERDISFLKVTGTGTVFSLPWVVNGLTEQVCRIISTRGTLLGISRESDTICHFMIGHAGGFFGPDQGGYNVVDELTEVLNKLGETDPLVGTFTLEVGTKFAAVIEPPVTAP